MTFSKKNILLASIPVAILLLVYFFYNPEDFDWFPKCPFYSLTGVYCPGCGSQRALHSLVHLEFGKTASYNFLFLPALGVVLYNFGITVYNELSGKQLTNYIYKPIFPKVVLIIVLLFWGLRNIPFSPFCYLAP